MLPELKQTGPKYRKKEKLATHLHLEPMLLCGAVPPLPSMPSGAFPAKALIVPLLNYTVLNSKQDNL